MTMVSEESKYLEWLNVVANTRLVFNTMSERKEYLFKEYEYKYKNISYRPTK